MAGLTQEQAAQIHDLMVEAEGLRQRSLNAVLRGGSSDGAADARLRQIIEETRSIAAGGGVDTSAHATRKSHAATIARRGAPLSGSLHTVKIRSAEAPSGFMVINAADFDPERHDRIE